MSPLKSKDKFEQGKVSDTPGDIYANLERGRAAQQKDGDARLQQTLAGRQLAAMLQITSDQEGARSRKFICNDNDDRKHVSIHGLWSDKMVLRNWAAYVWADGVDWRRDRSNLM
jgi:hypothetical protein